MNQNLSRVKCINPIKSASSSLNLQIFVRHMGTTISALLKRTCNIRLPIKRQILTSWIPQELRALFSIKNGTPRVIKKKNNNPSTIANAGRKGCAEHWLSTSRLKIYFEPIFFPLPGCCKVAVVAGVRLAKGGSTADPPCTPWNDLMGPRGTHGVCQGCGGCSVPPIQQCGVKRHCGPFTETEILTAMPVMMSEGYNWLFVVSLWVFVSCQPVTNHPLVIPALWD